MKGQSIELRKSMNNEDVDTRSREEGDANQSWTKRSFHLSLR